MLGKKPFFSTPLAAAVIVSVTLSSLFGFGAGVLGGLVGVPDSWLRAIGIYRTDGGTDASFRRGFLSANRADEAVGVPDGSVSLSEDASAVRDSLVAMVERVSPAVVSITVSKDVPVMEQYMVDPYADDPFFQQFFGGNSPFQVPQYRQNGTQKQTVGAGTGFLVAADGYIITNKHVVADTGADYEVTMADGKKYPAEVLARDPVSDIAVVKIDGAGFPFVRMGDSDALKVGQEVVAIGNALGQYDNTVSRGIVSGLRRSLTASDGRGSVESLYDVIQTDAAINPGNSGGPLINARGEAVGVNVAMAQGSQSIGFSLPMNDVRRVFESVRRTGKISRPWLGVRFVMINDEIKKANQLTVDHGALVLRGDKQTDLAVIPGSPADIAGIVENDIILEAAGKKLTEDYPLNVAAARLNAGDELKLKVLHQGAEKTVTVTLAERADVTAAGE